MKDRVLTERDRPKKIKAMPIRGSSAADFFLTMLYNKAERSYSSSIGCTAGKRKRGAFAAHLLQTLQVCGTSTAIVERRL